MKNKLIVLSGMVLGLAPVAAFAQIGSNSCSGQSLGNQGTVFGVICQIHSILNAVVPVLIALGVVYFVWGVITYVISSDEEAKKTGRYRIIYGIIGLAVIIGLWGLVSILTNTFNVDNENIDVTLPTIPVR